MVRELDTLKSMFGLTYTGVEIMVRAKIKPDEKR